MAKLEIPSIVVQNGSSCSSGSATNTASMERSGKNKSRLSKQAEFEEIEDQDDGTLYDVTAEEGNVKESNQLCDLPIVDGGGDAPQRSDSTDSEHDLSGSSGKNRTNSKVKLLVRSHAVRDDTSPPPPSPPETSDADASNTLSVFTSTPCVCMTQSKGNKSKRLGKQGSSQGSATSFEGSSSSLSRESSTEAYTDSTGIDLQQFIFDTLHKNQKDRMMLLRIEFELVTLARDPKHTHHKFPQMSSYHRMLVHRVAAFFGMDHNVDQAGTSVIVNKTKNTRIPEFRFKEQIKDDLIPSEPKKSILKRDCASFDEKEFRGSDRNFADTKRSKSFEEREEEYEKARARIFNQDDGFIDSSMITGPVSLYGRASDGSTVLISSSRLSSQEDVRWAFMEPRAWSSTDSDSSGRPITLPVKSNLNPNVSDVEALLMKKQGAKYRPQQMVKAHSDCHQDLLSVNRSHRIPVTKASSFCGISNVHGDTTILSPIKLLKSESGTSSSGIQVLSSSSIHSLQANSPHQDSSSPSTTSHIQQLHYPSVMSDQAVNTMDPGLEYRLKPHVLNSDAESQTGPSVGVAQQQSVVCAVSNIDSVPAGAVLINPLTGLPYLNPDGSVYKHDPSTTPIIYQLPSSNSVAENSSLLQQNQHQPSSQQLIYQNQPISLQHQESSSSESDMINQFSMMNFNQHPQQVFHQTQDNNLAEVAATNASGYSCLPQPHQMCVMNAQIQSAGNAAPPLAMCPTQQPMQYANQQPSMCYNQSMAMANQSQQAVQPVPQPSQSMPYLPGYAISGGATASYAIQNDPVTQQQQPYYPLQVNYQHQPTVPSSVKNTSHVIGSSPPVHYNYSSPANGQLITSVLSSRAGVNPQLVGMPSHSFGQQQQQSYPGVQQPAQVQSPATHQQHRPLLHSSSLVSNVGFGAVYQQHPSITPPVTPNSPQFQNQFSSFNVVYPGNIQAIPNGAKQTVTPPPTHNYIGQISSGSQLTKSCSFPLMDARMSNELMDPLTNPDMQLMGASMQPRSRYPSPSPASTIRGPIFIPRQPLFCKMNQPRMQVPSSSSTGTRSPKDKIRRQRSRCSTSNSNSNNSSNDNSVSPSQSQTPTYAGRNMLEVQGYPDGMKRTDLERFLEDITNHGGNLQFISTDASDNGSMTCTDYVVSSSKCKLLAAFESDTASQSALLNIKTSKFTLRPCRTGSQ